MRDHCILELLCVVSVYYLTLFIPPLHSSISSLYLYLPIACRAAVGCWLLGVCMNVCMLLGMVVLALGDTDTDFTVGDLITATSGRRMTVRKTFRNGNSKDNASQIFCFSFGVLLLQMLERSIHRLRGKRV